MVRFTGLRERRYCRGMGLYHYCIVPRWCSVLLLTALPIRRVESWSGPGVLDVCGSWIYARRDLLVFVTAGYLPTR